MKKMNLFYVLSGPTIKSLKKHVVQPPGGCNQEKSQWLEKPYTISYLIPM